MYIIRHRIFEAFAIQVPVYVLLLYIVLEQVCFCGWNYCPSCCYSKLINNFLSKSDWRIQDHCGSGESDPFTSYIMVCLKKYAKIKLIRKRANTFWEHITVEVVSTPAYLNGLSGLQIHYGTSRMTWFDRFPPDATPCPLEDNLQWNNICFPVKLFLLHNF